MKIDCRICVNWIDENLDNIAIDPQNQPHIFMGCSILGNLDGNYKLSNCKHYIKSKDLFIICSRCNITVPKVCVSFGECVNCTDTDLFCIDSCLGGDGRKFCTHFVRLHTEGIHLIDDNCVYDIFPNKPMPGKKRKKPI